MIRKSVKIVLCTIAVIVIIPVLIMFWLYISADMGEPKIVIDPSRYVTVRHADTLKCEDSYLRHDSCGLWEMYITGSGQERGAKQGALTQDLMQYQEDVFVGQIRAIIPSDSYLSFLRDFIIIFNRNLGKHIPLEYRDEIAAMSQFCTHEYDAIGTPYQRQLNYHAAHDIGHTMQQYMLVGCSSFGVWGDRSETGSLLLGRNFDFYVGDDFAKNKLVTFAVPDSGYRYASVGWAGMIGVLSGMNERGITVTINAAKGAIPTSASTPISILTREILQYASTIDEAYRIAHAHKTFVSESILIGSAKENRAAIIEKTPESTAVYVPSAEQVVCTNHFQSKEFAQDQYNVENIENSDSKYRYDRLSELLKGYSRLGYSDAVDVLRNRLGLNNEDIGIGNEMTLNQSIAHHSVVFMPAEGLMWVSTSPWQSGRFVCYDLKGFFEGKSLPRQSETFSVEPDSVFLNRDYQRLLKYRSGIKTIQKAIKEGTVLQEKYLDDFESVNPKHYYTYRILGDYYSNSGNKKTAMEMYKKSLRCSIPYKSSREDIMKLAGDYEK